MSVFEIVATFVNFKYDPSVIELAHAWDEWCIDGNVSGYEEDLAKSIASYKGEIAGQVTVRIRVPLDEIEKALTPGAIVLDGEVVE